MKTPLNYTGNKSRLMDQFAGHFPTDIGVFVDLFCGGATVGLSVNAKKVIFIDNNSNVINLLKHLSKFDFDTLLPRLEKLVKRYGLSYSAKFGYKRYRNGIEKTDNNGLKVYNTSGYDTEDKAEDYIDETSEVGRQKIKAVYSIRKRQARIQGNYKCGLETINNCRPVYRC